MLQRHRDHRNHYHASVNLAGGGLRTPLRCSGRSGGNLARVLHRIPQPASRWPLEVPHPGAEQTPGFLLILVADVRQRALVPRAHDSAESRVGLTAVLRMGR